MRYCHQCGTAMGDADKFCPSCGAKAEFVQSSANAGSNAGTYTDPGAYSMGFQYDPIGTVDTLAQKMRSLSTAWLVIGIIQIITGAISLCVVVGIAPLAMGIYNVVQSTNIRKQAESFQQWPVGIVKYFESRESAVIVILILNIFFGLLFGIIGSILEFTTKGYAMDHREELHMAEEMANRSMQTGGN